MYLKVPRPRCLTRIFFGAKIYLFIFKLPRLVRAAARAEIWRVQQKKFQKVECNVLQKYFKKGLCDVSDE